MGEYEVAIIGGGISGLGVALEATRLGLRTILFERERICGATSANSLRIIHGGFRYLQSFNIPRVIESIRAQSWFLENYSNHVEQLPCLMPLSKYGTKSKYPVMAALAVYRALKCWVVGSSYKLPDGGILSSDYVQREVTLFNNIAKDGALLWYDLSLKDPGQFANVLVQRLRQAGVELQEGNEVTQVIREDTGYKVLSKTGTIKSRIVVNASGPWLDQLQTPDLLERRGATSWCRAFNLVLKKQYEKRYALGFAGQKNLYFLVPRENFSVLGTGYLVCSNGTAKFEISESELLDFIGKASLALPGLTISREDVLAIEGGVLPIIEARNGHFRHYGRERIFASQGYVRILSTKYTTFMEQAKRALRIAAAS